MSSRRSTRIQLKNDNINYTEYSTFFDCNSTRKENKNECSPTPLLSEEELLELRETKIQQQRQYRERLREAKKLLEAAEQPQQKDFPNLTGKHPESQSEMDSSGKPSKRKYTKRSSLSEDQLLELPKIKKLKRKEYREKIKRALRFFPENELLELRKRKAQEKKEYRERIKERSLSDLLTSRDKNAQQQRQYRKRLLKEGKFLEVRARHTEGQRIKMKALRKQNDFLNLTLERDVEIHCEKTSIRKENEKKREECEVPEICSTVDERKLLKIPEQNNHKVYQNLTLEKVLELRWERAKQNYFGECEK